MPTKPAPTAAAIDRVIRRHLAALTRPGVLTVRPGFEITRHQLTGRVAIVATVHTKTSALPAAVMQAFGPPENAEPAWAYEREIPGGRLLTSTVSRQQTALARHAARQPARVDLTARIALQPNVHNKGFVIDGAVVVVSSQNFSNEGVRTNRDAGLIIDNAPIAQYFQQVFLSDWTGRAKPFVPKTPARAATRATAPRS